MRFRASCSVYGSQNGVNEDGFPPVPAMLRSDGFLIPTHKIVQGVIACRAVKLQRAFTVNRPCVRLRFGLVCSRLTGESCDLHLSAPFTRGEVVDVGHSRTCDVRVGSLREMRILRFYPLQSVIDRTGWKPRSGGEFA
jgi:hypothetical protein